MKQFILRKWLDYVFCYLLVFLFGGSNIWLGLTLVVLTFIYINALDNSTARVSYKQMLRFCLWVALPLAFANLLLTMFNIYKKSEKIIKKRIQNQ